jgi:hypothetical protein
LRQHPEKLEALIAEGQAAQPTEASTDQALKRVGPWVAAGVGMIAVAAAWLLTRRKSGRD